MGVRTSTGMEELALAGNDQGEGGFSSVRAFRRRCASSRKLTSSNIDDLDSVSLSLFISFSLSFSYTYMLSSHSAVQIRGNICLSCSRRHIHVQATRQEVDNSQLANTNRTTSGFKLLGTRWQQV